MATREAGLAIGSEAERDRSRLSKPRAPSAWGRRLPPTPHGEGRPRRVTCDGPPQPQIGTRAALRSLSGQMCRGSCRRAPLEADDRSTCTRASASSGRAWSSRVHAGCPGGRQGEVPREDLTNEEEHPPRRAAAPMLAPAQRSPGDRGQAAKPARPGKPVADLVSPGSTGVGNEVPVPSGPHVKDPGSRCTVRLAPDQRELEPGRQTCVQSALAKIQWRPREQVVDVASQLSGATGPGLRGPSGEQRALCRGQKARRGLGVRQLLRVNRLGSMASGRLSDEKKRKMAKPEDQRRDRPTR